MLNRSTASWARAGRRKAAFLSRWLSIMPPWVGSGCRQISVATGSASAGRASSPDQPQPVGGVQGDRGALGRQHGGRPRMSRLICPCPYLPPGAGPRRSRFCQHAPVPVPALIEAGVDPVGGPGDHVRRARRDLLVTARAAVGLRRARAGLLPHHPVPVGPRLSTRSGPGTGAGRTGALAADPARAHTVHPMSSGRVTGRAARHRPVQRRLRRPAHRPPAFGACGCSSSRPTGPCWCTATAARTSR